MQDINEFRPSVIPAEVDMSYGYNSVQRILKAIRDITMNTNKSRKFFDKLYQLGLKGEFYKPKDVKIEIFPNQFVQVHFYLMMYKANGFSSPKGQFGSEPMSKIKRLIKTPNVLIKLGLYGDPDTGEIVWDEQSYEQTLDHELNHLYQALSVAIKAQRMKKGNTKDSELLMGTMNKVQAPKIKNGKWVAKGTSRFTKAAEEASDPNEALEQRLKYFDDSAEIGSNAHAILRQLLKYYGPSAGEKLGSHVNMGVPSLRDIEYALMNDSNFKNPAWSNLTALAQQEMRLRRISRPEFTQAYRIKEKILKAAYDTYKIHYRRR